MGPAGQHMLNTCSIKTLLSSDSDEKKNQEYKRSQRNNLSLK